MIESFVERSKKTTSGISESEPTSKRKVEKASKEAKAYCRD